MPVALMVEGLARDEVIAIASVSPGLSIELKGDRWMRRRGSYGLGLEN
jgi:hypothetical protein